MITLLDGENIIITKRRHWFVILAEGFTFAGLALLPLIVIPVLAFLYSEVAAIILDYAAAVVFLLSAWMLLLWMLFFITWTNYYLDVFLVTNKRLVDIEQVSLFVRDIAELRLENIQDIKVESVGLIQAFLKMGNLHVQTAGQHKEVSFRNIPDIQEVKNMISHVHDKTMEEQPGADPI